jgi:RND family efflux transporter MFP subunit
VLTTRGEAVGVLTLEYPAGHALREEDLLTGEMVARLLAPVIAQGQEQERWFAGKLRRRLHHWREALLGPDHPSYQLAALAALLVVAVLLGVKGEFRITAKTVIEGLVQRAAVAPFDGFLQQAPVRAGDRVQAGQVLATLDDRDLQLEQRRWRSEQEQTRRKYQDAQARHERAAASVLDAQLNQLEAQLALVEEKLARTRIQAPFDGLVVTGDLSQLLGAPITQGKVLFEIAPLDSYRVILKVDERDIRYVSEGQKGQLALSGLTQERLGFTVSKVTPVATAEEGGNFFRVEAQLEEPGIPLRPGMEGIGKITVGEEKLGWLWTRRLLDWVRISCWRWLP